MSACADAVWSDQCGLFEKNAELKKIFIAEIEIGGKTFATNINLVNDFC